MKLQDLNEIEIRWDLTPQKVGELLNVEFSTKAEWDEIQRLTKELAGRYFYIDVWNCQARLMLMELDERGSGKAEVVEQDVISEDDMIEAIEAHGGAINISGYYPISDAIRTALQRRGNSYQSLACTYVDSELSFG